MMLRLGFVGRKRFLGAPALAATYAQAPVPVARVDVTWGVCPCHESLRPAITPACDLLRQMGGAVSQDGMGIQDGMDLESHLDGGSSIAWPSGRDDDDSDNPLCRNKRVSVRHSLTLACLGGRLALHQHTKHR